MRKGFITLALAAMLACGGMGMLNASAETELKGTSWTNASGAMTATHDATTGYTTFAGTAAWGARQHSEAVKVDGLTIHLRGEEYVWGSSCFGFGFVPTTSPTAYSPESKDVLDIHVRPGYNNIADQIRVNTTYDHTTPYAASNSVENALAGTINDTFCSSLVIQQTSGVFEVKYEFDYLADNNLWAITATIVQGTCHSGGQAQTLVQYVPGSAINTVLNDEGKAVISAWAMSANATFSLKLEEEKEVITTVENKEWDLREMNPETAAAHNPKVEYEVETGWNVFYGHSSYGIGATNVHKVDVDGLVVELYTNTFTPGEASEFFGFGFVGEMGGYAPAAANSVCVTLWPGLYGQGRLITNTNHDYGVGITFVDEGLTNNAGGTFYSSIVMNNPSEYGFRITFTKLNDDVYKMFVEITAGAIHGQQHNPITMYFSADYIESVADENGLVYLSSFGSSNYGGNVFKIRYTDKISAEYEAGLEAAKANLEAKVEAFEAAVAALGTESWAPAYAAYEAVIEARIAIWDNDVDATLDARLSAAADTFAAAVAEHTDVLDAASESAYAATLAVYEAPTAANYAAAMTELAANYEAIEAHAYALDAATVASYVEAADYYYAIAASFKGASIDEAFAAAEAAVANFEKNVGSANIAFYETAIAAVSAANETLASDKGTYGLTEDEVAAYEAVAAEWPTRIDAAKAEFDAAEEALVAVNQLNTAYALAVRAINTAKANPTNETYDAASKALDEANAKYATLKSKISAEKQAAFEATAQQCATDLEAVKASIPAEGFAGCTGVVVDTMAPVLVAFAAAMLLKKRKEN